MSSGVVAIGLLLAPFLDGEHKESCLDSGGPSSPLAEFAKLCLQVYHPCGGILDS